MAFPSTLQPLWDALQQEVIGIHAYWINYRQLFGKTKERLDLLNECAPLFFYIIDDALLTDVQLSLSRLADPAEMNGRKNATLERLVNDIATLGVPQLTTDVNKQLDEYRQRCKQIKKRRNRELAHADLGALLQRYGGAKGTPITGPSRQEIEDALHSLREFMNVVDLHFSGSPMAYNSFISHDDGESLVWVLKQGLRYAELTKLQEIPLDDLKRSGAYDS